MNQQGVPTRAVLVVHTKPVEGREEEFDRWYEETHLPEVLALDGFVSARRFRAASDDTTDSPPTLPYLAIYEIEPGQLSQARTALADALAASRAAVAEGRTPVLATTDALHEERIVSWFEEIADVPGSALRGGTAATGVTGPTAPRPGAGGP